MPADTDPATACINTDFVMHVECDNSGPTNSGQPEKTYPRSIPGTVVGPGVLTGMKYGHRFASQRIGYPGGWPCVFVTPTAGKTPVVKRGLAALSCGEDVVHNHGLTGLGFGCLTVRTTVVVCFYQLTAQCGRQVCAHSGAITCRREAGDGHASGAKPRPALCGACSDRQRCVIGSVRSVQRQRGCRWRSSQGVPGTAPLLSNRGNGSAKDVRQRWTNVTMFQVPGSLWHSCSWNTFCPSL